MKLGSTNLAPWQWGFRETNCFVTEPSGLSMIDIILKCTLNNLTHIRRHIIFHKCDSNVFCVRCWRTSYTYEWWWYNAMWPYRIKWSFFKFPTGDMLKKLKHNTEKKKRGNKLINSVKVEAYLLQQEQWCNSMSYSGSIRFRLIYTLVPYVRWGSWITIPGKMRKQIE